MYLFIYQLRVYPLQITDQAIILKLTVEWLVPSMKTFLTMTIMITTTIIWTLVLKDLTSYCPHLVWFALQGSWLCEQLNLSGRLQGSSDQFWCLKTWCCIHLWFCLRCPAACQPDRDPRLRRQPHTPKPTSSEYKTHTLYGYTFTVHFSSSSSRRISGVIKN